MKTSTLNTIAILATVASLVVGDSAFAKGGGGGHSGGGHSGSSGSHSMSSHSSSSGSKMSSGNSFKSSSSSSKMGSSFKSASNNSGKLSSHKSSSNTSKTTSSNHHNSNGSKKTTSNNKTGSNNKGKTASNGNKTTGNNSSKTANTNGNKKTNGSNGNKQSKNDSGKTASNGNKGKHDSQHNKHGDHDKHGKHDHGCFSDFFCSTYCYPSYGCSDYGCSYGEPVYCDPSYCEESAPYADSTAPVYAADPNGPVADGLAPVAGGDAAPVTGEFADAGQAFEPFHSTYNTLPGDSFYTVSLKEYGTSAKAGAIAQFNGMSADAALTPGQELTLPAIAADGTLSQSNAPVAETLAASVSNTPAANSVPATPASFTTPAGNDDQEVARTQVPAGSTLLVDGQNFGSKPGSARLRIGGGFLKLTIAKWAPNAVKVSLPKADQAGSTDADLEIVRADGSVASRSALEVSSSDQVAANN